MTDKPRARLRDPPGASRFPLPRACRARHLSRTSRQPREYVAGAPPDAWWGDDERDLAWMMLDHDAAAGRTLEEAMGVVTPLSTTAIFSGGDRRTDRGPSP